MKTAQRLLASLLTLLGSVMINALLSGCAGRPSELSKSQWGAMSPKEQADYRDRENERAPEIL